jgi:GntR family transcriptional regulator/MocR family aminotransferase
VLARFLAEGRLAAHLRRMRVLYAGRREALLQALRSRAADLLDAGTPPEAGLHLAARLRGRGKDVAISRRALALGVHAAPLSVYYVGERPQRGFVLGFAGTPAEAMIPAVERLTAAIRA